ncbi:hypothetical protein V8D89_008728 [Ganoderma adspersum]
MPVAHAFTQRVLGYYICAFAVIFCTAMFNFRAYHAIRTTTSGLSVLEWNEQDFSYLEDDYPPTLIPPSRHLRNAALVMEEMVHYLPNMSQDWESMIPAGSEGFVHLGPTKRLFGVSMYHQIHCLTRLQQSTTGTRSLESFEELALGHLRHCLNYLSQTFLCTANVRLEPLEDDSLGVPKTDGMGLEHRCRDWTVVWCAVEANIARWGREGRLP